MGATLLVSFPPHWVFLIPRFQLRHVLVLTWETHSQAIPQSSRLWGFTKALMPGLGLGKGWWLEKRMF